MTHAVACSISIRRPVLIKIKHGKRRVASCGEFPTTAPPSRRPPLLGFLSSQVVGYLYSMATGTRFARRPPRTSESSGRHTNLEPNRSWFMQVLPHVGATGTDVTSTFQNRCSLSNHQDRCCLTPMIRGFRPSPPTLSVLGVREALTETFGDG